MTTTRLEHISIALLSLAIFLVPLLFIPSIPLPLPLLKETVFFLLLALGLVVWVFGRLKEGEVRVPQTWFFAVLAGVPLAYFLSSLFSSSVRLSLVGNGMTIDAFAPLFGAFLFAALIPSLFRSRQNLFYLFLAFFTSLFLVAVFQIARLAGGPAFLSFGIFGSTLSNLVGSWVDLGIFFGFGIFLALVTLELLPGRLLFKWLLWIAIIVGLGLLAIINMPMIWAMTGIIAFGFLVYLLSCGTSREAKMEGGKNAQRRGVSLPALVVVVVALIFLVAGGQIGSFLIPLFSTNQLEARPSLSATLSIGREALKINPLFGVGPGRFVDQWLLHKPDGINETVFWNSDFLFGVGFIPTALTTTGVLGLLAWLTLTGFFLWLGARALFVVSKNRLTRFFIVSSFLGGVYLLSYFFIYNPSFPILILLFMCFGIFISALVEEGIISTVSVSFSEHPKVNFAITLIAMLLIGGAAVDSYFIAERFVAYTLYTRARMAGNVGNLDMAESRLENVAGFYSSDELYRSLVELRIAQLNSLLRQQGVSSDVLRSRFQTILAQAIQAGESAVTFDSRNYLNWVALGNIYEAIVPLKIDGAYDRAYVAYGEAIQRNPQSPGLRLLTARLAYAKGNTDAMRSAVAEALKLKSNYTEAIFFLSQTEVENGNIAQAIANVEAASLIAPNDPAVFFRLGFLRYSNEQFKGAASALENAVRLNPVYANARYFLGLSYWQLDRNADAIQQFETIATTNPDNAEIKFILANLKVGKSPFANAKPPVTPEPERREKPPVDE